MSETVPEGELVDVSAPRGRGNPPPAGGAVYGLGLIGALVWYWRQADGVGGHVVGVLKAVVWPAFLVYEAFEVLRRLQGDPRT
jgi:hypothetical protein